MCKASDPFSALPIPWRLIEATSLFRPIRVLRGTGLVGAASAASLDDLVADHFAPHPTPDHVNRASLHSALRLLGDKPARFLETGSPGQEFTERAQRGAWRSVGPHIRRDIGLFVPMPISRMLAFGGRSASTRA